MYVCMYCWKGEKGAKEEGLCLIKWDCLIFHVLNKVVCDPHAKPFKREGQFARLIALGFFYLEAPNAM